MQNLLFNYPSIHALATSMHTEAESADSRSYSPRPHNVHNPTNSTWWLVPSTDWPAHRHGKITFTPSTSARRQVLCGLHVEKGFGNVVALVPGHPPKQLLVGDNWEWPAFMSGLRDGSVAEVAQQVALNSGEPVALEIHLWVPGDYSQFDPFARYVSPSDNPDIAPPFAAGQVNFQTEGATLQRTSGRWLNKDTIAVDQAQRLSDLPALFATKAMEWLWIDVYLGVLATLSREAPDAQAWLDHRIWRELLSPWRTWVV